MSDIEDTADRLCGKVDRLLQEFDRLCGEVDRLREALRIAAEMSDHEEDRTIIHNHCMQAIEGEA